MGEKEELLKNIIEIIECIEQIEILEYLYWFIKLKAGS